MLWLRNPSVDTAMPNAMSFTPFAPNAMLITAVAGVLVAARASGPSARKQTSGKVKFWLLENYMSREMKDFLPR